jgi:hypothetical protein
LGFDICHLSSFYVNIWTLIGSPFKSPPFREGNRRIGVM